MSEKLEYKKLFAGHSYGSLSFNVSSRYGADFAVGLTALMRKFMILQERYPDIEEFWYTERQMKEEIGFSYYKRKKVFRKAIDLGIISVKAKGLPQRDVITFNIEILTKFLKDMVTPGQKELDLYVDYDEMEFGFVDAIHPDMVDKNCKVPSEDIAPLAEFISQTKANITNKTAYANTIIKKIAQNKYLGVDADYDKFKEFIFAKEILEVEKHIGRVYELDENLNSHLGMSFLTIDFLPDESKTECLVAKYQSQSGSRPVIAYVHDIIIERFLNTPIGAKLHATTKQKLQRYIDYHRQKVESTT